MADKSEEKFLQYIKPLVIDGLHGRVLSLPAPEDHDREILFIYGQHSTIERWRGLSAVFNEYGAVTMPDLPGFGGMDSFYKIGKEPTMDNLADYLATFIKSQYGDKRLSIAGMSIGFAMVTRMLQRHPDIAERVDLLVSIVGLAHHDDFLFTPGRMRFYRIGSTIFSRRLPAWIFRNVFLQPAWLRRVYKYSRNAKQKFEDKDKAELRQTMDMEIILWHANDLRTQMFTNLEMFKLDNCTTRLPMPVWHVDVEADRYFDGTQVERHYRMIFSDFYVARSDVDNHAPSVIADAQTAAPYLPPALRHELSKAR
ncbi:MAG: hypothetical protein JWN38_488 [Candidatus Saccharibacteria bacterium]|nr:hypothetical protein [Candidatus Saccharibacteria bacterium]